jgi:hypothetical protein
MPVLGRTDRSFVRVARYPLGVWLPSQRIIELFSPSPTWIIQRSFN